VFDLPALIDVLRQIRSRAIRIEPATTEAASPFARSLVFDYVAAFLYEGDAPLAGAQGAGADARPRPATRADRRWRAPRPARSRGAREVEAELQQLAPGRKARNPTSSTTCSGGSAIWPSASSSAHVARRSRGRGRAARARGEPPDRGVRIGATERYIAAEDAARYRDGLGVQLPPRPTRARSSRSRSRSETLVGRYARKRTAVHRGRGPRRAGACRPAQIEPDPRAARARTQLVRGELRPGGTHKIRAIREVLRQLRRRTLASCARSRAGRREDVRRVVPGWHGSATAARHRRAARAIGRLEGSPCRFSELRSGSCRRGSSTTTRGCSTSSAPPRDRLGGAGALGAKDAAWCCCAAIARSRSHRRPRRSRIPRPSTPRSASTCGQRCVVPRRDRGRREGPSRDREPRRCGISLWPG